MKTSLRTIAKGFLLVAAGVAFARLLGPKACGACSAHCGQKCRCRANETHAEAPTEGQSA
ncbi:MAG: hypothetical protein ACXVHD_30065 [Solirubrobacteraceae bacterium]